MSVIAREWWMKTDRRVRQGSRADLLGHVLQQVTPPIASGERLFISPARLSAFFRIAAGLRTLVEVCRDLVRAARPAMWLKPLFLMLAAGAYALKDFPDPYQLAGGFAIAGPLLWGGLYILNAVTDFEDDRAHPVKCLRPIAAGRLHPRLAASVAVPLIVAALVLSLTVNLFFAACVWLMCAKQLAYTLPPLRLKRRFIWDVASGSLFNSTLRFGAGWALFGGVSPMPLLLLVFSEALQLGGFLVNRLFTGYGMSLERTLGYQSTTARLPARAVQWGIVSSWLVGIGAFIALCVNSLLQVWVEVLGALPIEALLVLVLLVAALPVFGQAVQRAQRFTPREAAAYYDLPLLWVFALTLLLTAILKWFG